ncbi:glycosyltransferase family 4 protein [Micromonospora chersina]|uniref:glycosyltransferase family 4 protein n=1 Tax=Micromonospora chersina TaxID=47854 RepID=UPI003D89B32A
MRANTVGLNGHVRRPNVTILIANLPAERDRRVIRECLSLEENGYDVTVIAPRGKKGLRVLPGSRNTRLKPYPIPVYGSGLLSFAVEFAWSFLCIAVRLLGEICRGRAQAVQVCNPPDVYWPLALLLRALGRPWVFDHHDLCPEIYATRREGRPNPLVFRTLVALEWLTLRTATAVVTTNESFRANALRRGVAPGKVTVVRNGPASREIAPGPDPVETEDDVHHIVYLGVLGKQDHVAGVVNSAAELARLRGRSGWRVTIAGDGETLTELRELADTLGLADLVQFPGWLDGPQVDALLQSATVAIQPDLPTQMNQLSTMAKTVEYVSRGVPVVAVDLIETRRTAGEAAVYVPTGDPAEIAAAVDALLSDPQRRAAMRRTALARFAEELSWEHQSVAYAAMWGRVLPHRQPDSALVSAAASGTVSVPAGPEPSPTVEPVRQ